METSEEKILPSKLKQVLDYFIEQEVLINVKAIMVGKPDDEVYYDEYKEILIEVGNRIRIPTIYNINFGHAFPRATIPYGIMGEIDFDEKRIKIIEKI